MNHTIHRVTAVQVIGPYAVDVEFADGTRQEIDLEPVLGGEIYGPLRDTSVFQKVQVDPEIHTLLWPNGADFDPAMLHDWPVYAEAFRERAEQWEAVNR